MTVHAFQAGPQMHIRAVREVGAAFLPTGLRVATQASLIPRFADHVRFDGSIRVEQRLVVDHFDPRVLLHRACDGRQLGARSRRPAEVPSAQLLSSLAVIVAGHVTQQAVRFDHPRLGPLRFVVVAVQVVIAAGNQTAGRVAHPTVIAFPVAVELSRPASRMAASAGRRKERKGRHVDRGGRIIFLGREVAVQGRGRTPTAAEIAGARRPPEPRDLLGRRRFAHALRKVVALGNLFVVVALAAGRFRRIRPAGVFVFHRIDDLAVFVPQMKRRANP